MSTAGVDRPQRDLLIPSARRQYLPIGSKRECAHDLVFVTHDRFPELLQTMRPHPPQLERPLRAASGEDVGGRAEDDLEDLARAQASFGERRLRDRLRVRDVPDPDEAVGVAGRQPRAAPVEGDRPDDAVGLRRAPEAAWRARHRPAGTAGIPHRHRIPAADREDVTVIRDRARILIRGRRDLRERRRRRDLAVRSERQIVDTWPRVPLRVDVAGAETPERRRERSFDHQGPQLDSTRLPSLRDRPAVGAQCHTVHREGAFLRAGRTERAPSRDVPCRDVGIGTSGHEHLAPTCEGEPVHDTGRGQRLRRPAGGVQEGDAGGVSIARADRDGAVRRNRNALSASVRFQPSGLCVGEVRSGEGGHADVARDEQDCSPGVERERAYRSEVGHRAELLRLAGVGDAPQRYLGVVAADGEKRAVRTEGDRALVPLARGETPHQFRLVRMGDVPQLDRAVATCRGQNESSSVRAHGQTADNRVLDQQRTADLDAAIVPEPDGPVRASRREHVVLDERDREGGTRVAAGDRGETRVRLQHTDRRREGLEGLREPPRCFQAREPHRGRPEARAFSSFNDPPSGLDRLRKLRLAVGRVLLDDGEYGRGGE